MKRTKHTALALLLALCFTLGLLPALTVTASAAALTLCDVALAVLYAVTRTAHATGRYPAKRKGLAALVLTLCLTLGLLPALTGTAYAAISVTCDPPEGGTVSQEDYDDGDWRLVATPNTGYVFDCFRQGGSPQANN